jgi:hypothetical protein
MFDLPLEGHTPMRHAQIGPLQFFSSGLAIIDFMTNQIIYLDKKSSPNRLCAVMFACDIQPTR